MEYWRKTTTPRSTPACHSGRFVVFSTHASEFGSRWDCARFYVPLHFCGSRNQLLSLFGSRSLGHCEATTPCVQSLIGVPYDGHQSLCSFLLKMMRLAVLIAFAQRLCGAERVCDGFISEAVGMAPVVGNFRDVGCGLAKGDAWDVAFGVVGVAADAMSFGAYSAAKAAAKAAKAVRAGQKGQSLAKAARTSKWWWTASTITTETVEWFRWGKDTVEKEKAPVVGDFTVLKRGIQNYAGWDIALGAGGLVADGTFLKASASAVAAVAGRKDFQRVGESFEYCGQSKPCASPCARSVDSWMADDRVTQPDRLSCFLQSWLRALGRRQMITGQMLIEYEEAIRCH